MSDDALPDQQPDFASAGDDAFATAVDSFRAELTAAFGSQGSHRDVLELYGAYAAVFHDALQAPEVTTLAAQRFEAYARGVAAAFSSPDAWARIEAAYRSYVADAKAAWAAVDPVTIDASDLASIAEEMGWVAGVAGAVRQFRERDE
jgi:hypothetical protein